MVVWTAFYSLLGRGFIIYSLIVLGLNYKIHVMSLCSGPSRHSFERACAPSFLWHALSVALKVTCQVGRHTLCLSSTSLSSQNDHLFQSMLDQSWTQYLSLEVGRVCQIRVPGPDIRGRLVWLRSVVLACGRALG
jgi:hypothetical protein